MLPLYATYDSAYFKPRPVAHRAERLIQHVIDKTWHDPSFSDRLLQCAPLELQALCSKRPTNKCNDHLLVFEPEQVDEYSLHYLLSDEDTLKLTFCDALAERSIPNLVLPHIKEITIDTKSAAILLEERGLVRFMEESKVYVLMDTTSLDPLASIERDMIRYAPIAHDEVDTFRILQIELEKSYASVFSHHTYTETIPLECLLPVKTDENHLASRKIEHFLHSKKNTTPVLVYNCKHRNFTEEVLNRSAELAMVSQYPQHDHTIRDTETNSTGQDKVALEQWQDLLSTSTGFSSVTYFGDVGEILPDFATEPITSVSLADSSTRYNSNSNSNTLAGTGTAQAVLAQLRHIHVPSMTRVVPRDGGNRRNTSQSSVFMFAPHLLAHFAGTTQRLIDLESPWQLMPCQPHRRKGHCNSDKGAQRARSAHAADVVAELGVSVKQLQRNPPALHLTSVYSSALDSHFLRSTEDVSGGVGRVELKKERVNELQQFVETAAMNAIPDQDEEDEERRQEMTARKRPYVENEDYGVQVPHDDCSKKPKLTHGYNAAEGTDETVAHDNYPQQLQKERRGGESPGNSAITATIIPTQTASHRHSAAAVDAPLLTAHPQLSVLPAPPSVAADPSTSASRRHPPRSPVHPPPSRNKPAAPPEPVTSFQLPSFNFNFDLNAGGEGGLVEQYLRLQRGVAPAGTRTTHASTASRAAPTSHFVTPQRHPPHTDSTAGDSQASLPANRGASAGAPSSCTVAQVATVTPARTTSSSAVSATAITDRDAVHLRVQQLAAHNITSFSDVDHPLTVLISESFLELYFTQVAEGLGALGVVMLDCPLQEPVSLILDAFIAVCVVTAECLQNTSELKILVKKLSEITFKFTKIHVVVVLTPAEQGRQLNKALLTLTQAVSRFPAAVSLRQCAASPTALVAVLEQLCSQSLRDSMMHQAHSTGTSARHFHRPFLDHLQHCDAKHLAHCEYLQLFPTLNFHTGAALLYHHPLRELLGQRAGVLCDLFAKQYVFCEELKDMLKSFVALLEAHAGLQLAAEVA